MGKDKERSNLLLFHKNWLNYIRRSKKISCNFIAHEKDSKGYSIKCVLTNKMGGRDTINYRLTKSPDHMTNKDYKDLVEMLENKNYDGAA